MHAMQGKTGDASALENIQRLVTSNVKKFKKSTVLRLSFIKLVKYKKRHYRIKNLLETTTSNLQRTGNALDLLLPLHSSFVLYTVYCFVKPTLNIHHMLLIMTQQHTWVQTNT